MIGNVVSIMWLLFMTIALVMICVMAYTSIKTDFGCMCDAKEVKRLKKTIEEQQKDIKRKQRLMLELQRENEILWEEKRKQQKELG